MAGIQSKIALGCALMLGVTAPLVAQNEHQELVSALLDAAEELAAENGFSSTHSRYNGALDEGREDTITIDLDAGTSYFIVGQCDIDCSAHNDHGRLRERALLLRHRCFRPVIGPALRLGEGLLPVLRRRNYRATGGASGRLPLARVRAIR